MKQREPIVSVLNSYGPIDRAIIARKPQLARLDHSTLRRGTEKTPEYRPFSRDDYSLGRYQRASSARLARRIKKVAMVVAGLVLAVAAGAVLAAFSSGFMG